MASVVTAAPTDGAPLLGLSKLDKHFGATHALKVVIGKGLNYGVATQEIMLTEAIGV